MSGTLDVTSIIQQLGKPTKKQVKALATALRQQASSMTKKREKKAYSAEEKAANSKKMEHVRGFKGKANAKPEAPAAAKPEGVAKKKRVYKKKAPAAQQVVAPVA